MIQPPKPAVIDFSDKIDDEPIGSEMDIKLAQTIAWREKQLSQVLETQNTTAANDWINNGGKRISSTNAMASQSTSVAGTGPSASVAGAGASTTNTASSSLVNHLTIGDETSIDEHNIINVKKVTFVDTLPNEPVQALSFMDKLKKKDVNEDAINNLNNEITLIRADIIALNTLYNTHSKTMLEQQEKMLDLLEKMTGII
jgi:hypothetical protein